MGSIVGTATLVRAQETPFVQGDIVLMHRAEVAKVQEIITEQAEQLEKLREQLGKLAKA